MAAIRTDGLTKRFGSEEDGVVAVNDLNLRVDTGEVFGFLGPNGAGKSTTINMLLDFVTPTAGSAEVLGFDTVKNARAIRDRVGVLPEGYAVYERLTGREHLEWVIEVNESTDEPAAILDRVGLRDDADRRAGDYSKGMQQRLALGIALVGNPEMLILDEPSSGLDPTGMQEMREIVRQQAAAGTTVFFSSHLLDQVESVCDRIGILHEGKLVAADTIENLREDANAAPSIQVKVTDVSHGQGVNDIDGVNAVSVKDDMIRAVCDSPRTKIAVTRYLDRETTVTDIISEDTSLEELFNRYTNESVVASNRHAGQIGEFRDLDNPKSGGDQISSPPLRFRSPAEISLTSDGRSLSGRRWACIHYSYSCSFGDSGVQRTPVFNGFSGISSERAESYSSHSLPSSRHICRSLVSGNPGVSKSRSASHSVALQS